MLLILEVKVNSAAASKIDAWWYQSTNPSPAGSSPILIFNLLKLLDYLAIPGLPLFAAREGRGDEGSREVA
jgi:hypothetical protein